MAFKLNYKIVGRERPEGQTHTNIEHVFVQWRHADGPIQDTKIVPVSHPPDIKYETVSAGEREIVEDCISVPVGTPDSTVAMMCDEKRAKLAKALGIEP